MRAFYVYGFKSREEYGLKSVHGYDNALGAIREKRNVKLIVGPRGAAPEIYWTVTPVKELASTQTRRKENRHDRDQRGLQPSCAVERGPLTGAPFSSRVLTVNALVGLLLPYTAQTGVQRPVYTVRVRTPCTLAYSVRLLTMSL